MIGQAIGETYVASTYGVSGGAVPLYHAALKMGRKEGIGSLYGPESGKSKVKRNPLDSHKPGCMCLFHSGRIFKKGADRR